MNEISAAFGEGFGNYLPAGEEWHLIDGDPIKYAVGDKGGVAAWVCQPNGLMHQYFAEYAWGSNLWLQAEPPAFSSSYYGQSAFTPISHTQIDPWTIETVFGAGDVQVRQTISYTPGELYVKKRWEFFNSGETAYNELRFFHGGDSYFGGDDSARAWWDPELRMVYINNSNFAVSGIMGFYANPATPADHYFGGSFYTGYQGASNTGQLPDTTDSSYTDAGYQLQWNRAVLGSGETWVVEAFETWTHPSSIQVIAPADANTAASSTVIQDFKLHNLDAEDAQTVDLGALNSQGWLTTFPEGTTVTVAPLERISIPVSVEVPVGASPGIAGVTTISTSVHGGALLENAASARVSVIEIDYSISSETLDFDTVAVGSNATRTITITNSGDPLEISSIGNSDGLAAPFFLVAEADACSNSMLASGESCTLSVSMAPTVVGAAADSFNIPILAPATASHRIDIVGTGFDPALEPPSGHSISFDREVFTAADAASASFTLTNAQVGASYAYTVTSSGGGTPVTGSGTVSSTEQPFGGIDFRGLADGTLTLSMVIANEAGIEAEAVTHTATLDTAPVDTGPLDSDGDQMPDEFELEHGLDPFDSSDAAADNDRDGISNVDEFHAGTNPQVDDYPPLISVPAVVEIESVGLLTPFPTLTVPTAVDSLDGDLSAVLQGDVSYLPPGAHTVTWTAVDAAGNRADATQQILVHPQISLGRDQARAEGSNATIRFHLNGLSPDYPLTVAYEVGGTATLGADHDLYPGTVVFEEGEIEKSVPVTLVADGLSEGDETIEAALVGDGNFGARRAHVLTIVEDNVAPKASLTIIQGSRAARLLTADGGPVLFSVEVDDPNPLDAHTFEWWFPSAAATVNVDEGVQSLDPASLPAGVYEMRLVVRDSGTPPLETEVIESFRIVATAPELSHDLDSDGDGISDADEGYGDVDGDGIPDYLDAVAYANVLTERSDDGGQFLIEADPGVRLVLGESAQILGGEGASLTQDEAAEAGIEPDEIVNVGGYFDFVVRDVPSDGASIAIVLPQRVAIPASPLYRKFDGIWFTFVEDARNRLASAPGLHGICPPPGSDAYQPGLESGDWCVELTIEDGGPNDTDGLANGAIRDPGGVGTIGRIAHSTTGGGGGGGAFGWQGILGLFGFAVISAFKRRQAAIRRGRNASRGNPRAVSSCVKIGAATVAAAVALPAAHAELPRRSAESVYVAAHLGGADTRISRSDLEADFAALGTDATVTAVDAERAAFELAVGYTLAERWAIEAGYLDLGEVKVAFDAPQLASGLARVHPVSADGFTLAGVYRHRIGQRFGLIARAGLFDWEAGYSTEDPTTRVDRAMLDGRDWLLGFGAEYSIAPDWAVSAELQHYDLPRKATRVLGFGVRWRIGSAGRE